MASLAPDDLLARWKEITEAWVAIPSVSTDPAHKEDCRRAGQWLADLLYDAGGTVELLEGYGNPIVLGRVDVGAPTTIVVYGHYDVQPAAREEGWATDPFELVYREGRYFARGVMDNKGQVAVHLAAVLALKEAGALAHNVVFFVEGDEETGSPRLADAVQLAKEHLRKDVIVVSDGVRERDFPTLEMSFRGGFNARVWIRTLAADQHSGMMSRVVPNAPEVLVRLLAHALQEGEGGLFEILARDAPEPSVEAEADLAALPFDREAIARATGAKVVYPQNAQEYGRWVGLEPSLSITTLRAGYLGEGYRNALAASVEAKINVRLAPQQDPEAAAERFREWWRERFAQTEEVVEGDVVVDTPYRGVMLPRDNPWLNRAARVWEEVAGRAPVRTYCGGSIPVVTLFHEKVGAPLVVTPLASEGSNIHGPNENLDEAVLREGLVWSARWFGARK
ncbi:MAG: hypothetical protein KatS3mg100_045 [Candidatus Parcubacteria bacterium]|nr:MAG: hypothetical protein KatS3mg100_045 [Candidatus Parcubacteria bacterium]